MSAVHPSLMRISMEMAEIPCEFHRDRLAGWYVNQHGCTDFMCCEECVSDARATDWNYEGDDWTCTRCGMQGQTPLDMVTMTRIKT